MNQPFHGDEIVFSESAKGILKTGKPIFDYSAFEPNFQGLWHIPLYSYFVALFVFFFGQSIYSFRAVSAFFNVLVIILVYLISKEIFSKEKNKEILSLIAMLVYALNPLTIQSSVVMDIDGGLLNFAVYLFLYFFIRKKSFFYLIPSLLFVFLSKESGPVILFISLMTFYVLTLNFKKIPKIFLLFFVSGILFLIIFLSYCSAFGLNFLMPLEHNFKGGSISFISLMVSAWSFKTFFYFSVPFFVLSFFILSFIFYYMFFKNKEFKKQEWKDNKILLLNLFAIVTIFLFFYLGASGWGFPKYYITALPAMSIFIVHRLSKEKIFKKEFFKKKFVLLVLVFILLSYFLVFIPSPLMPEFDSTAQNAEIAKSAGLIGKSFCLYFIIPFFICLIIFYLLRFKHKILISLIFLSFFMFVYLNSLHAVVPYSTYYNYGDIGVLDVVDYFRNNSVSAGQIATYPHLGSYLGMSDYYEITWSYNDENDFKEKIIDNTEIGYIVIYKRDIERIGENMKYFKLKEKIGSYYVFRRI